MRTLVFFHQACERHCLGCKRAVKSKCAELHGSIGCGLAQDNPPKQDKVHNCDRKILTALHNPAHHEMWSDSREYKVSLARS